MVRSGVREETARVRKYLEGSWKCRRAGRKVRRRPKSPTPTPYRVMSTLQRINDIEEEIARTQKNKATEYHIGRLKARLAQLR